MLLTRPTLRFALLGAALCCAPPLVAQPSSPVPASAGVRQALAYQLAAFTNSEAAMRVQMDKLLRETLPQQFAAQPDFAELEAAYPGVSAAMVDAMAPIMLEDTLARMPDLWKRIGSVYAAAFSESELQTLIGFYRSPAGVRLLDAMRRNSDMSKAVAQVLNNPDSPIRAEDLRAGQDAAISAAQAELTPAELDEIGRFEASPLGAKLLSVAPQAQQVSAAWSNESTPELDAKLDKAMQRILSSYIEGKVSK